jgi:hypothetical protein
MIGRLSMIAAIAAFVIPTAADAERTGREGRGTASAAT